jgi:hypothetical protein
MSESGIAVRPTVSDRYMRCQEADHEQDSSQRARRSRVPRRGGMLDARRAAERH